MWKTLIFALAVLGSLVWSAVAAFAVYVVPYGVCYLKIYDCPEGILVRLGIVATYLAVLAAGVWAYRRLERSVIARQARTDTDTPTRP